MSTPDITIGSDSNHVIDSFKPYGSFTSSTLIMVFIPTPTTMTDHLKNSVTSNLTILTLSPPTALALKIPILFSCSVHIFIYLGVLENTNHLSQCYDRFENYNFSDPLKSLLSSPGKFHSHSFGVFSKTLSVYSVIFLIK